MCLVEQYVMSVLCSLNKKLDMKKTLKMPFGRRPSKCIEGDRSKIDSCKISERSNEKWQSYSFFKGVK